jgi:translation initiation factor 1
MSKKVVLFLGPANHDRSRAAEALFNAVAGRMGLSWTAVSRGLNVATGPKPKGPMLAATVKALEALGHRAGDYSRPPLQVADADFAADRVVAVTRDIEPLARVQFAGEVEYWQVAAGDVAAVESEVMGFVTRLLGGRMDAPPETPAKTPPPPPKKVLTAKVGRETAGRKGKGVTTVFDLDVSDAELQELAAKLKQRCGTGGTVKDGRIEIQGDNRDRIVAELEKLGFRVKRAGG